MLISIDDEIFKKYPTAEIGYVLARVAIRKIDPFVEELKQGLLKYLEEQGMNATNFAVHPNIALWRKIYEKDFLVKPKTYRSSVEALLRRVVTGKGIWNICNVVDLYNCCSIISLLPMGAYDLDKISGGIQIRYAREGEVFHALGEREKVITKSHEVVYADEEKVLCWLWNHKDSAESCIDDNTKYALFFIDSAEQTEPKQMQEALECLKENLEKIQGNCLHFGILNKECPSTNLQI